VEVEDAVQLDDEEVVQVAALRREESRIDSPVGGDPRDVVGDQALEERARIWPAERQSSALVGENERSGTHRPMMLSKASGNASVRACLEGGCGVSGFHDLVLKGGMAVTPSGVGAADIAVDDGRIAAIGQIELPAREVIDATGLHVLPGVIDSQVHFREPGLEHKEDLATGTTAAVLGGVTAIMELPNPKPNTVSAADLAEKLRRARGRARCDHAFFVGAAAENLDTLGHLERLPGCAGVKIFMGSSTGTLLVADDDSLRRALASGTRRMA